MGNVSSKIQFFTCMPKIPLADLIQHIGPCNLSCPIRCQKTKFI